MTIQHAAVGLQLPDLAHCRFDAIYSAADYALEVGGDWYDALSIGDGRVVISVGDVMAADLKRRLQCSTFVKRFAASHKSGPSRRSCSRQRIARLTCSIRAGASRPSSGSLTLARSAARSPMPVTLRRTCAMPTLVFALVEHGLPLGFLFTENYTVHEVVLAPGTLYPRLVMASAAPAGAKSNPAAFCSEALVRRRAFGASLTMTRAR